MAVLFYTHDAIRHERATFSHIPVVACDYAPHSHTHTSRVFMIGVFSVTDQRRKKTEKNTHNGDSKIQTAAMEICPSLPILELCARQVDLVAVVVLYKIFLFR